MLYLQIALMILVVAGFCSGVAIIFVGDQERDTGTIGLGFYVASTSLICGGTTIILTIL